MVEELRLRWGLTLAAPFDGDSVSCGWVARAARGDGTRAVLKIGMPQLEGAHEIAGLRFWNGDATVRLLDADTDLNAMLLEECEPGTSLRELPEREQDVVIAGLLRRLWRTPPPTHPFRPLAVMLARWAEETRAEPTGTRDEALVRAGLQLFEDLSTPSAEDVVLATDLHAGNVLRARREPWLVIDPKPFVGDRAYEATQHLLNCPGRLRRDADRTIARFADLAEIDRERLRLWLFARAAAEPGNPWNLEPRTLNW